MIFFLIHKSVNTATEWNLAEGSQSAEVMNFFAFKDVVHQEDEGNQTLHWQPTNGTCTKTVHKFCSLPEIWVSKDYCVQLHLKHLIHYTVGISCILYPHIYTWHSKTARGFLFFFNRWVYQKLCASNMWHKIPEFIHFIHVNLYRL